MFQKLAKYFGAQDMTSGSPARCLVQFSVPLLIGNLAQQLYNTVDSIVVGHYVGDGALAAVGASGAVVNLLLVLFMGISTGATIMVSQYFGAKQRQQLSYSVGTALVLTLLSSLFVMIVGPLLTHPMLSLLGTPEEIFDMSSSYLMIIFIGIAGSAYYNIVSGMLRGLGDSVMPLLFLFVACGLNIVLDIVFVAVFNWGVAGVAWATIIAQFVSAVLCLIRLFRMKDVMTLDRDALKMRRDMIWQLTRLGLPSGVTQAIFSMAQIVVQSLTNSFGTIVIACATVIMRVDGFCMMPNFTFGTAMTTYTGQNIGAGKMDRVDRGTRDGLKLGLLVSVILTACILLFGNWMMSMFTQTQEVIDLGVRMMRILAVGYIAMSVTQILSGVMRGAGDTVTPMWISLFTTVVVRVTIAYGLAWLINSPDAIYISLLASWVLGAVVHYIFFRIGKWRSKGIAMANAASSNV